MHRRRDPNLPACCVMTIKMASEKSWMSISVFWEMVVWTLVGIDFGLGLIFSLLTFYVLILDFSREKK